MKLTRINTLPNTPSQKPASETATLMCAEYRDNAVPPAPGAISTRRISPSIEITVGRDPQRLIQAVVAKVKNPHLRAFVASMMAAYEVNLVLCQLDDSGAKYQRFPVERLRSAAEMASYWCAFGAEEKEVLFVATLVHGIQCLLAEGAVGTCSPQEVMRAVVLADLHRLDRNAARQASLLRLCLGWGNEDEVDEYYVPRLQTAVKQAIRHMRAKQAMVPQRSAH